MGEAARAVQALSALNFEGSQAAKAVALAMEGNMSGFQRMIPALRNAKTEAEKVAAVNKVLAAGYEQQKANLNTVGGAWEALKGRIGDAREDIVGAIFEGFALGKTFNSMQAAVGRFLKSDTFNDFKDRLKSGAAYVKQIIEAMGTDGGTKEVLAAMGNVIVAAFKRGGEIVAEKILSAFRPMKDARAIWKNRGLVGAVMRKSPIDVAGHLLTKYTDRNNQSGTDGQRELDAALKAFSKTIKENVKEYEQLHDRTEDENELARRSLELEDNRLEVSERTFLSEKAAAERDAKILEAKEKQLKLEGDRNRIADDLKSTEESIRDAADREQAAREEIADAAEERAGLMRQSISEWIAAQQDEEKRQKDVEKQNAKDRKRAGRLRADQDRGVRLSPRDRDWLNKFDKRDMLLRDPANIGNAAEMAGRAQEDQGALNKRLEKLQQEQKDILSRIEEFLKESLEVD